MGWDYFIFYVESSLVCILILAIMLINDRIYRTQQEKQVWFSRAIITFILYFITDACWAGVLAGLIPRARALVAVLNFTNYALLALVAYEWFMFMAASEKMAFRKDRKMRILCFLPVALSVLAVLVAYAAYPYFWIGEDGQLNSWYYPLLVAAPAFYLLSAFVFSMINIRKTELREEKQLYWLIAVFPLGVMAFGLIQLVKMSAPTFCFGCTVMLLYFYIQNMQTLISVDALTRLNNRGQINRYMEQVRYRENVRVFAMMIDINQFKQINDNYGHAEGDRALMLVSDVLKRVCERLKAPAFLGRYGGDEFLVILQNPDENQMPGPMAEAIRRALAEKREENQLPYELGVSLGYEELRDRNDTMRDCLIRADEKLYQEKRAKGTGR